MARSAVSRRELNAESTRRAILAAGRELFARNDFVEVSGAQICERAGVTRGALQHHFDSKLGLFIVVFDELQHRALNAISQAVAQHRDPWEQARAGIKAFLTSCIDDEYRTVVLQQAPLALGWWRWRELDADYFSGTVGAMVEQLGSVGLASHPPAMLVATVRGALTELSFEIVSGEDAPRALQDALGVVDSLLVAFGAPPP